MKLSIEELKLIIKEEMLNEDAMAEMQALYNEFKSKHPEGVSGSEAEEWEERAAPIEAKLRDEGKWDEYVKWMEDQLGMEGQLGIPPVSPLGELRQIVREEVKNVLDYDHPEDVEAKEDAWEGGKNLENPIKHKAYGIKESNIRKLELHELKDMIVNALRSA